MLNGGHQIIQIVPRLEYSPIALYIMAFPNPEISLNQTAAHSQPQEASFGIVPIAQLEGIDQFLLIQHHAGHWGFPKGHAEPGETPLETACREFEEETGIRDYQVSDHPPLVEQYQFVKKQQTVQKTVTYFIAWVRSMQVVPQEQEIRGYLWLPYEAAFTQITFEHSQQLLRQVQQIIKPA